MSESDQEWVTQAQAGDRAAFDELMARYEKEIVGLSFRLLGHREDALELAQEVLLRAWRGLKNFRKEAKFRSWLYQITLNCARNQRRWHVRHRTAQTESLNQPSREEGEEPMVEQMAGSDPTGRDSAQMNEFQQAVLAALTQIPTSFKAVVILRDMREMSYDEIAQVTQESVGTVKSRLHRGRAMLRAILMKQQVS